MRTWVIPFVLLALAQSAEALCLGRVNLAGDDPPYRFAATYIDALVYGKQAGQRMTLVARDDVRNESVFASATRALTELELAAQDFECAASFMSSQESYPSETSSDIAAQGSRVARLAAGVSKQAYLSLADGARSDAQVMEEILAGRLQPNETPPRMARIGVQAQKDWETVMYAVAAVTHLLVDPQPDAAGLMSRLRITASQRLDLVKSIDVPFGESAGEPPNDKMPVVDASAAMLRQFLTGGHSDRGGTR